MNYLWLKKLCKLLMKLVGLIFSLRVFEKYVHLNIQ